MDEIRIVKPGTEPPEPAEGEPREGTDDRDAKIVALAEAMTQAIIEFDLELPDAA